MSHSFTNLLYHVVFGTKNREPWLNADDRPCLFAYLGGLIRHERGIALIINGVPDHVHIRAKLKQDKAVSDVIRAIKAGSSLWLHQTFPALECFAWQTGYGAFTVSQSQVDRVRTYIQNQEAHHRNKPFRDELLELLRANEVEFAEEDL